MRKPEQLEQIEESVVALLRERRKQQGLSQANLAAKMQLSRTAITHIESGLNRPTLRVLLRMAEGLGVELAEVLEQASHGQGS